jgi:hypothetical protein
LRKLEIDGKIASTSAEVIFIKRVSIVKMKRLLPALLNAPTYRYAVLKNFLFLLSILGEASYSLEVPSRGE